MEWKNKLNLLHCIVTDLEAIHSQQMIHRDLHSGNILQDTLDSAYIVDLGLSIQYLKQDEQVYGVLPYVAPEVLIKKTYSIKSDIYSFGIIMWEVLYGSDVRYYYDLHDKNQDQIIQIVIDYLRPPINDKAPRYYVELMEKCWDKDPETRPSAEDLCEIFKNWQYDEQILSELNEANPIIPKSRTYENAYSGSKLISTDKIYEILNN
ncbi:kinase-like domain-containing protein [Gigaspora rosea]|uniref:Kinase-like domain-containing protein n=1 Tax=Gigaspora rosea TaxID=44941 RepID=A0A397TR64_9GLOM|nr:kinase-like domain-containing protein [Gigaspora rosea]